MSSSTQNLLDAKLPDEIGLKELKIMQLKKKKVRVSASIDMMPHPVVTKSENPINQLLGSVFKKSLSPKNDQSSTVLPVIENKN
jgi:hypothetical protein